MQQIEMFKEPKKPEVKPPMFWKYAGHNSHVNEDDYRCSACNRTWGFPTYCDPIVDEIGCPHCEAVPGA